MSLGVILRKHKRKEAALKRNDPEYTQLAENYAAAFQEARYPPLTDTEKEYILNFISLKLNLWRAIVELELCKVKLRLSSPLAVEYATRDLNYWQEVAACFKSGRPHDRISILAREYRFKKRAQQQDRERQARAHQ